MFGCNLFDAPDLAVYFRQLMGLGEHNAFEYVGHIEETRLAMKRCLDKGLKGHALTVFRREVLDQEQVDWAALQRRYDTVYSDEHAIPTPIFGRFAPSIDQRVGAALRAPDRPPTPSRSPHCLRAPVADHRAGHARAQSSYHVLLNACPVLMSIQGSVWGQALGDFRSSVRWCRSTDGRIAPSGFGLIEFRGG